MADKITIDFENNLITWDTDTQQGTEYHADLKNKKAAVLQALGYKEVDITNTINAFNNFLNGKLSQDELAEIIRQEEAE